MFDLRNQNILITGGTGSFGKKCAEILLSEYGPKRLIIFSRDELKQHDMRVSGFNHPELRYFIGDVRDVDRLRRAMVGVEVVIHAAALKQVPACEYNPIEAIQTNVNGGKNVIEAALDNRVHRVLALSSDKAVNPVNLYGATKLVAEKLFVQANAYRGGDPIRFACVRYGNVVGSRGSVVPLFREQRQTGQITITDPRMTRFWLTLEQGVRFVLNRIEQMHGGEVFVPKIPSIRIIDLAKAIAPECRIREIGIRPGEKLHEVLLSNDEARHSREMEDSFVITPLHPWWKEQPIPAGRSLPEGFRYASDTNTHWLTIEELQESTNGLSKAQRSVNSSPKKSLPYGRQCIGEDDIEAVVGVLRSDWLTTGPSVDAFERDFAEYVGADHAVAVSSGTAGLHAAMYAAAIGSGDEVIVPSMTFAATANAVVFQGGTPVFADVERETLLIDTTAVEGRLTRKTKAIVAVDYAGQPCEYETLSEMARQNGTVLIADGCHALGASVGGKRVGSLADLTVFSFHPVKHITTGEGGMVTTNNAELAKRMRIFRNHGITTDHRQRLEQGSWFYEMTDLGYNYRISDFQCALGQSQLRKLTQWVERRQEIAAHYDKAFTGTCVKPLRVRSGVSHAFHIYVIRLKRDRQKVFAALRDRGIRANVHYIPVHLHPYYRMQFGLGPGLCPIAEEAYEQILTLPIYPAMTEHDVDYVVDAVREAVL